MAKTQHGEATGDGYKRWFDLSILVQAHVIFLPDLVATKALSSR